MLLGLLPSGIVAVFMSFKMLNALYSQVWVWVWVWVY
jgi:hypothetical protein